jgi:serine/threonine-protein kinase RsbW
MNGTNPEWLDIESRLSQVTAATAFVETFGRRHGVAPADVLRLSLMVEELLTNVVVHGHGTDSPAPVRIGLQEVGGELTLCFEDTAPAFDPHSRLPQELAELEGDTGERPVGHLGLPLIFRMARASRYERTAGWNRLRLILARAP